MEDEAIANSSVQVNCSPKTYERIHTNPEYQAEILNYLKEEQEDGMLEEVNFALETQGSEENEIEPGGSAKTEWMDAPTRLLISLLKELKPQVGKCMKLKNKKKMWITISEELCSKGYMFTSHQVETKYYSLERRYKKTKLNNAQTGRNKQTCPYQTELDDILAEKREISPEFILSEDLDVPAFSKVAEMPTASGAPSPASALDTEGRIAKKRSVQDELLTRLDAIMESTNNFENTALDLLKQREERAKREEVRKRRKLELLETLVAKITSN